MDLQRRRDEIRREARAKHSKALRQLEARGTDGPRAGDLYVIPEVGDLAVEWAVLEHDSGAGLLVVPADISPLAGRHDVAVEADAPMGALVLRCAQSVRAGEALFRSERRGGVLPPEVVQRALEKARRAGGPETGTASEREVDLDPEYQDWIRDVAETARARLVGLAAPPAATAAAAWSGDRGRFVGLAASALLCIGLASAGALQWHRTQLDDLREVQKGREDRLRSHIETLESDLARAADSTQSRARSLESERAQRETQLLERIADLEKRPPSTPAPVLNPALEWFQPRRGEVRGDRRILSVDGPWVYVVLETWSSERFATYRVELLGSSEKILWQSDGLTLQGASEVIFGLPSHLLPEGDLAFRLLGLDEDRADLLEEYPFRIVSKSSP